MKLNVIRMMKIVSLYDSWKHSNGMYCQITIDAKMIANIKWRDLAILTGP